MTDAFIFACYCYIYVRSMDCGTSYSQVYPNNLLFPYCILNDLKVALKVTTVDSRHSNYSAPYI